MAGNGTHVYGVTWHISNVCCPPGIVSVMGQCGLLERELDGVSSSSLTSVGPPMQRAFVLRRVRGGGAWSSRLCRILTGILRLKGFQEAQISLGKLDILRKFSALRMAILKHGYGCALSSFFQVRKIRLWTYCFSFYHQSPSMGETHSFIPVFIHWLTRSVYMYWMLPIS